MRRAMSVGELKRYWEGRSLRKISFCSENQVWSMVEDPMRINLIFTSILVARNPNAICLKNGESTLQFERVKRVYVDEDVSPLGTVLDIVCGDSENTDHDMRFTLVAS